MSAFWGKLKVALPFLVIAAIFVWAAATIFLHRQREAPPGVITLRLGHWQLEGGVRDGLNELIADYQKLHPNVRIIQDAIPETVYGQWTTTQLMGETAPDLMEVGVGGIPYQIFLSYCNRYFVPMTDKINQANPYNKGTSLEGVPLRDTFKDGMRSAYIAELQQYMSIQLSQFASRIFYNKDLLRRLTGDDKTPPTYRDFLAACRKIASQKDARGNFYVPIAGSKYHFGMWEGNMADVLTFRAMEKVDLNRDALVGNDELYVSMKTGRVDFYYPPYAAKFRMIREVTSFFQSGFTGLTRDDAVFLFAQQRAVFLSTGTWDAGSLLLQAKGKFEVGVMDFPLPKKDDPEYGPMIMGPRYENPGNGFPFYITRTCQHPDIAFDFLLFLASQKQNEKLNRIIGWIPGTIGADTPALLKDFQPHMDGVSGMMNLNLGGETYIRWLQLYSLYQVRQVSFEDMVAQFEPFYKARGERDFLELRKDWHRGRVSNERLLASFRAEALLAGTPEAAEAAWIRYREFLRKRQIGVQLGQDGQIRQLRHPPSAESPGPYEYSPAALEHIRATLRAAPQGGAR